MENRTVFDQLTELANDVQLKIIALNARLHKLDSENKILFSLNNLINAMRAINDDMQFIILKKGRVSSSDIITHASHLTFLYNTLNPAEFMNYERWSNIRLNNGNCDISEITYERKKKHKTASNLFHKELNEIIPKCMDYITEFKVYIQLMKDKEAIIREEKKKELHKKWVAFIDFLKEILNESDFWKDQKIAPANIMNKFTNKYLKFKLFQDGRPLHIRPLLECVDKCDRTNQEDVFTTIFALQETGRDSLTEFDGPTFRTENTTLLYRALSNQDINLLIELRKRIDAKKVITNQKPQPSPNQYDEL